MAITRQESEADVTPAVKKKSVAREWLDSIVFAVVAATLIRWIFMEAFTIPTPSMERSLMVGDFLFVSKLHYGTRTPRTPLQVPLTHQTIWGTKIPSYSTAIQLPSYRLPGFTKPKSGDVVVFNYPPEDQYPADLRTNYIKRCVGAPGDVLEVREQQVFRNSKLMSPGVFMESDYFVRTTEPLDEKFFRQYDIVNDYRDPYQPTYNWQPIEEVDTLTKTNKLTGYRINTTADVVDKIKAMPWAKEVIPYMEKQGETGLGGLYGTPTFAWNRDNYGPLVVPKKGETIQLDEKKIAIYGTVIQKYEDNKNVEITPTTVKISGQPITTYTFKQDYYFMMGDNRHNSADSRYWGFVPEDHIVGKAVFVWMSLDPNPDTWYNKVRWSRLFRVIN